MGVNRGILDIYVSTAISGELDNGRGRARLNLFRHLHEVQTGRTSSISLDFLGFDSNGTVCEWRGGGTACWLMLNENG